MILQHKAKNASIRPINDDNGGVSELRDAPITNDSVNGGRAMSEASILPANIMVNIRQYSRASGTKGMRVPSCDRGESVNIDVSKQKKKKDTGSPIEE